ncbi:MAG: hypothetical protein ABI411_14635 [Tahibacter sp.]
MVILHLLWRSHWLADWQVVKVFAKIKAMHFRVVVGYMAHQGKLGPTILAS